MKNLLFVLLWLTTAHYSIAQTATNQPILDLFENMDMNQVPTGILKERGFPVFDMDFFDGQTLTDTNRLDANRFGWIYMQLMLGNVNTNTNLPDPAVYMNQYTPQYIGSGSLPIAIANYRYNYVKTDALSQNLMYVSNEKFYDTPNRSSSPYDESTLFAATLLADYSTSANVSFTVPNDLYLSNQSSNLQLLQIDLGDGAGFITTTLGSNLSAYYTSNGLKTIKIKVTLDNGNVYQSHTTLDVSDPNNTNITDVPPFSYNNTPDLTTTTTVGNNFATLSYFFHCPNRGLQKPFIFIEGFNPSELRNDNWRAMFIRLTDNFNLIPQTNPSMWQRLYDEGYDLIHVDFKDGAGDIIENAQLVKQVIRDINARKLAAGSVEKTRVLGASMGGIVGKWALREMETAGEAHDVDKFFSFDSPLKGANVPLGIQFLINDIANRSGKVVTRNLGFQIVVKTFSFSEFVPLVKNFVTVFNKPATKQMLFHNAWAPNNNFRQFHDAFYSQFDALGDLQQAKHIKISNGSSIGQPQLLNPSELYASVTGFGFTPQRIDVAQLSMDIRVNMDLKIFAIPTSGTGTVYDGKIFLALPIGISSLFRIQMLNLTTGNVAGLKPFDSAPGGFENFDFPSQASSLSFDRVKIVGNFGTKTEGLWGFVPTFSALGVSEPLNVMQAASCSANGICQSSIDANARSNNIKINNGFEHNQQHVSINQANYDFILTQIRTPAINISTVNGNLTRIFNFGKSNQAATVNQPSTTSTVIEQSVNISNNAAIWINRAGKIGFTDENNLLNQANASFTTWVRKGTTACQTTNPVVTVNNGGALHLGDPSVNNIGIMTIQADATVRIMSGGNLNLTNNSQLIIESGGRLIIEAGANINLLGATAQIIVKSGGELLVNGNATINLATLESKIIFQNGGELVINSDFTYAGTGYLSFERGNKLTLNTNWTLAGAGRTARLINVEDNAQISVNNGRLWTIRDALVRKVGSTSGDVVLLNNGATFAADNVTFDDQVPNGSVSFVAAYEAVDLDNSTTDMEYSFRNCTFANTHLAVVIGGGDLDNRFSFRNLNAEFVNTTFTDCPTAYYAEHGHITTFDNCTILRGGIDVQRMYWLQMRNTTMRGAEPNTAFTASTVGVKLLFSIHNWITDNCLISDYGTGIDATEGINGNIRLVEGSTIQRCGTAIKQNGGADFGLLYMDCARILGNRNSIMGRDVLLAAYTRGNTANIYRREIGGRFRSLYFDVTFQTRQETDIWLHGSYFDAQRDAAVIANTFLRFLVDNNGTLSFWPGTLHLTDPATPIIVDPQDNRVQNCGGVELRDGSTNHIDTTNAVVLVNGQNRDVRIQQNAALAKMKQNKLSEAIALFAPVAAINDNTRNSSNSVVRHFVDVARVMAKGTSGVTMRSESTGWLPETLVEMPKEVTDEFIISPNPASDAVQVTLKNGNYTLRVSNTVGQTIFTQNTEGVLSVNVATWTNGTYLFELTDKATNKRQRSKVVVQH